MKTTFGLLAAGFGALDWSLFVVGVFIALVLIAAFVWGSLRKRREPPPAWPRRAPDSPDPDSWTTRDRVDDADARRDRDPSGGS
jgi:hypothetical protein